MRCTPGDRPLQELIEYFRDQILVPAEETGRRVIIAPGEVTERYDVEGLRDFVLALKDHPALWGWDPGDEPREGETERRWADTFLVIKYLDGEHPILLNGVIGYQPQVRLYPMTVPHRADLFSTDTYPVQGGRSIRELAHYADWAVVWGRQSSGASGGMIVGNYPAAPPGRLSSFAEQRVGTYLAVINGAQHLQWFLLGFLNQPAHHDLYRAIWRLNRELHALTGPIFSTIRLPVYVDGDEKKNLKERDFHLLTTVYRDNVYLLVACVAEQSPGHPQRHTRVELRLDRLPERYL